MLKRNAPVTMLRMTSQSSQDVVVKNLVATIDELLGPLMAVYNTEGSGEAFHIMDFLKDM